MIQITILLALTADLCDRVPLDRMTEAEQTVRKAAAEIPAEVSERLDSADKLSDEDRETIIEIARKALEEFPSEPASKAEPEQETEEHPKPEAKSESGTEPKSGSKRNPKPEHEQKTEKDTPANAQAEPKSKPGVKPDEAKAEPQGEVMRTLRNPHD